jgi:phosphopantetheinyl transferase (holo-ACP synthase)
LRHVGNDIVDLLHPHAQGKSNNTRFRKRIFLPEEENLLLADRQPDAMLWALWTGKEAAYKAIQKDQLDIAAIPLLYKVQFDRTENRIATMEPAVALLPGERRLFGTVATPRGDIYLDTLITARYVHSLAASFAPVSGTRIVWQVERMPCIDPSPADASLYVRTAAKRHLAQYLSGKSPQEIEIRRDQGPRGLGPPSVYLREQATAIDISLSHEGAYAAYAFAIFPPLLEV